MKLLRIRAAGFRGIRDMLDLRVPAGFLVITGNNGAGKTTICDAIEYALTGTIERYAGAHEDRESLAEYIWWRGDEPAAEHYVEIELIDDEGQILVVRRDRVSPSVNVDLLASALCYPEEAPEDWVSQLCRTSIIRDDTIAGFSFDLAETDRFEFVQASVGSADIARHVEVLRECDRRFERQRSEVLVAYNAARDRIVTAREDITSARSRLASRDDAARAERALQTSLQTPPSTSTELLKAAKQFVATLRKRESLLTELLRMTEHRSKQLEALGPDFNARLDGIRKTIADFESQISEADAAVAEAERVRSQISKGSPVAEAMASLSRDAELVGLIEGRCPVCRSEVSDEELQNGLEILRHSVDFQANLLREATDAVTRAHDRVMALRQELATKRSELSRISADAEIFEADTARLRRAATAADLASEGAPTREAVEEALTSLRQTLPYLQNAIATVEAEAEIGRIINLERTLENTQKECDELLNRQNKIEAARERARAISRTVRHVAGEVLEEKLASLAPLLSDLYFRIRPHANWRDVQYRLRGDVRRFLSLRVGPDLNPRFIFSSGQRRATGLAFLLSVHLSRAWCRLETLVLDDPVQHIDDFRALHLVEVLSAIRQLGEQVICCVEDHDLAALLGRRLRAEFEDEGEIVELNRNSDGSVGVKRQQLRPMAHVLTFAMRAG